MVTQNILRTYEGKKVSLQKKILFETAFGLTNALNPNTIGGGGVIWAMRRNISWKLPVDAQ